MSHAGSLTTVAGFAAALTGRLDPLLCYLVALFGMVVSGIARRRLKGFEPPLSTEGFNWISEGLNSTHQLRVRIMPSAVLQPLEFTVELANDPGPGATVSAEIVGDATHRSVDDSSAHQSRAVIKGSTVHVWTETLIRVEQQLVVTVDAPAAFDLSVEGVFRS